MDVGTLPSYCATPVVVRFFAWGRHRYSPSTVLSMLRYLPARHASSHCKGPERISQMPSRHQSQEAEVALAVPHAEPDHGPYYRNWFRFARQSKLFNNLRLIHMLKLSKPRTSPLPVDGDFSGPSYRHWSLALFDRYPATPPWSVMTKPFTKPCIGGRRPVQFSPSAVDVGFLARHGQGEGLRLPRATV